MEKKKTLKGKSYWAETGAYQKELNEIFDKLVPSIGKADTVHGELVRSINNLSYDWGNNGNGNAVEPVKKDCPECGGSGWETINQGEEDEEEVDCSYCGGDCSIHTANEFREDFEEMVEFIQDNLPKSEQHIVEQFKEVVLELDGRETPISEQEAYNNLTDAIMHYVTTTENKPRT